jgi:hypothetical protein
VIDTLLCRLFPPQYGSICQNGSHDRFVFGILGDTEQQRESRKSGVESRLQIDASSDCANNCIRGIFYRQQQRDLHPPGPVVWQ